MCANVTLRLCAIDIHFCAQMKTVRKRNFRKMCANVIAPAAYMYIVDSITVKIFNSFIWSLRKQREFYFREMFCFKESTYC